MANALFTFEASDATAPPMTQMGHESTMRSVILCRMETQTLADSVPVSISDPVNARILAISEDRISGFSADPIGAIAAQSGVDPDTVILRIKAMLEAGVIRRVRQTLLATSLADGALVAWQVPAEKLNDAFDFMFRDDPFSGHVVIRSTDGNTTGSRFRLWTTLKVPQGYSIHRHCQWLAGKVGAEAFHVMPAKCLFTLGVGHVRRREIEPGSMSEEPAVVTSTDVVELSPDQWAVLVPLKREFAPDELQRDLWSPRAAEAGFTKNEFIRIAQELAVKGVIGRFSTFLEHVKPLRTGEKVTQYNALYHWAVEPGRELDAGRQVGRFHIMTHAYWREGGPDFGNVNIMGVAHGRDKQLLLEHKKAIDTHLEKTGIRVSYTNVFWGGRSEIKPSEFVPAEYEQWCRKWNINPDLMRK